MAYEFRLPDIGEGLTEAEVVRWLVDVGAEVGSDQPLVEVETDKAVVEIPAPRAGVLLHQGAPAGSVLAVGEVLAVIGAAGESWDSAPPIVGTLSEEAEQLAPSPAIEPPGNRPLALPLVRKLARDMGLDLADVTGSGPGGRVTREDVLAAAETPSPPQDRTERVRLSKLRRTIAANMTRSWREIPHVTTFDSVDGTRLLDARKALQDRHQRPIPLEALVAGAVIPLLTAFPEFNASLDGDDLVVHRHYDIGFAVDTPDGLLVAVCHNADRMGTIELAGAVARLTEGARSRSLAPEELAGQTFTISNIGAVGGGYGTPIIPFGTTAILSVGRADQQPVVRGGQVDIARMIPLSLSYDHRVIDGGLGRRFVAQLGENLEEPALFLSG